MYIISGKTCKSPQTLLQIKPWLFLDNIPHNMRKQNSLYIIKRKQKLKRKKTPHIYNHT